PPCDGEFSCCNQSGVEQYKEGAETRMISAFATSKFRATRLVLGILAAGGIFLVSATLPCRAQTSSHSQASPAQPKEFRSWPGGAPPQEIGKRVAQRFVSSDWSNFGRPGPPKFI